MENSIAPVRRALISVTDKTGLVDFARGLYAAGVELVSTGGSAACLRAADLPVREVSELTGLPEMFDGRMKTLHPFVHGGILARRGKDEAVLDQYGIKPIDLVVVNLYPFAQTVGRPGAQEGEIIEMIDIGGPAMIRAAAKNWTDVTVVTNPQDYADVVALIRSRGGIPRDERRRLAARAFARTAAYDAVVANWFSRAEAFPPVYAPRFERLTELRYGENPHQRAALYRMPGVHSGTVVGARQLQGKPLSFNNLADADAALTLAWSFELPACVIVKHQNPCGVAVGNRLCEAYGRAFAADPMSAFGGVIAGNREMDLDVVTKIFEKQFVEVIVAPAFTAAARTKLVSKPNLRVLACGESIETGTGLDFRRLAAGILVQDVDRIMALGADSRVVTRRAPDARERRALDFAWHIVQAVRSNAIVLARDDMSIGIGAGQTSRVGAVRLAGEKAREQGHETQGAVLASDGFFPFRDNVDEAFKLGVRALVQPGGSRRDEEVVCAADELGMAMIFTGSRHFRH